MRPPFQSLQWNPNLDWWSGRADLTPDHAIDIHLEATNDPIALEAVVAKAMPAWARLRSTEPSIRDVVANQWTAAHNDNCDPDDEVTAEQFARGLRLLSAKFEPSGAIELVYDDGMLLGGHWIVMSVAPDGTLGMASEAG